METCDCNEPGDQQHLRVLQLWKRDAARVCVARCLASTAATIWPWEKFVGGPLGGSASVTSCLWLKLDESTVVWHSWLNNTEEIANGVFHNTSRDRSTKNLDEHADLRTINN